MNKSSPLLSVIMPVYNGAAHIAQAIESVLNQTERNLELIVVDDASEDESYEIVKGFKDERLKLIGSSINRGKVSICNDTINLSSGYYITIHDADDWSEHDRFEKQLSFLESHTDFAMCGCGFFQHTPKRTILKSMPTEFEVITRNLPRISQFHGPTIVFRKNILEDVGGLYRNFTWGEDIDFTARVVEKYKATNINQPLYHYRIHENSLTNSLKVLRPERFANVKLREFLAEQRRSGGKDWLMTGNMLAFENKRSEIIKELNLEPSEMYWDFSQRLLYQDLYHSALVASFYGFKLKPSFKHFKNMLFMLLEKLKSSFMSNLNSNEG